MRRTAATPCQLCGSVRIAERIDAEMTRVHCPWCKGVEVVEEMDVRAQLQKEWGS